MNEAKKRNVIFALIAVAIAVVFFFAGFGTGYGAGKGAVDAPEPAATDGGGMVIAADGGTDKGVSLVMKELDLTKMSAEERDDYGVMPLAETAYTVTATVEGEGLTDEQKKVTWSEAAFKDPSSEWATGKSVSDYVTTSPNGNQITVSCAQAFGEQIIIKCTSTFNTAVSKDLTVDYVKGIAEYKMKAATALFSLTSPDSSFGDFTVKEGTAVTVHMPNYKTKSVTPPNSGSWMYSYFYFPMDGVTWGTGTIDNSLKGMAAELKYSSAFVSSVPFYNTTAVSDTTNRSSDMTKLTSSSTNPLSLWTLLHGMAGSSYNSNLTQIFGDTAIATNYNSSMANPFLQKLDSAVNPIEIKLTLTLAVGETVEYNFYLDPEIEPATYLVQGVTLDQENIKFHS